MEELTFKVISISSQKSRIGYTNMRLICIQDSVIAEIEIPNCLREDKSLIRSKAIDERDLYLEFQSREVIDIGTII